MVEKDPKVETVEAANSSEIPPAPKAEVTELVDEPKNPSVCPDPNCPSCFLVGRMLEAFEAAVYALDREMAREQKNFKKIDLIAVTAFDLGGAFARFLDRTEIERFAVPQAKKRFVIAAETINKRASDIRQIQLIANISKTGKMN